jgi:hypothetical protein
MDDLIERLDELSGPRYPDDICGKQLMAKAATALRAYAERGKELVEALEAIAFARNDRVGPGLPECISIARAILFKHKGQT